MSYAIQHCATCGKLEHGHTGPADQYECVECYRSRLAEIGGAS